MTWLWLMVARPGITPMEEAKRSGTGDVCSEAELRTFYDLVRVVA